MTDKPVKPRTLSPLAVTLLEAHVPGMRAYLCQEIGLTPNADSVALIDNAYSELVEEGYVEEVTDQNVMVFSGGAPKHPFRLTEERRRANAEPGVGAVSR